ncbi:CapA family protein [Paenibacillus segetis]|uniref:Capsular polysaccharide biosynthesis protein n=1 Tax=Paenibacillus segetis TaxID=1325360 RepID=A0ABQ1Y817_9BACL|nr:CapA family protein [Paenibacillus segetis]GGH15695.1 capsular polysaccharide biosynthesis protein [Paenibacillus segetis]
MSLSRMEKNKRRKKKKSPRQGRVWVALNLTLITAIVVLGTYFYIEQRFQPSKEVTSQQGAISNEGNGTVPSDQIDSVDPAVGTSVPDGTENEEIDEPESKPDTDLNQGEGDAQPNEGLEGEDTLLLHFAGDTMFSDRVAQTLNIEGYEYPFKHISDLFQNDDLSLVNLETPVTSFGTKAEDKTFVFKSSPEVLPFMAKSGIDAVNLANNHILDQGAQGLLDTISHLKDNDIKYFGAGSDTKEAYAPIYIERKGIKIAICGFSRVIPKSDWAAGKGKPGVATTYDSTLALKAIKTAKEHADIVLVMVHWGKERTTVLEKHQTSLAHEYIDAGADLVIGGHPHVMQGIEQYKGKWIVYSTGNFIFTKNANVPDTWETAIFETKCNRKGACDLKMIPYLTEVGQPVPMNYEDGVKLFQRVESLSSGVKIANSGEVTSVSP